MEILIQLVVFLVIAAIVWWLIQNLGLPEPFRIVAIAIIAIVAIILLLQLVPHGGRLKLW